MTDPLDALHLPVEPSDPDQRFAERLRAELRQAVLNPLGGTMTETAAPASAEDQAWGPTLSPYIVVSDARRALAWYVEVLGARQRGELYVNDDGTIGHAEIALGDAVLMFSEASELWPEVPVSAPAVPPSTHSHTLHLQVDDVDGVTRRAVARGATMERPPTDQPYGRGSVIVDPFGHRWMLLKPPARATRHRHGDISYVTMVVADDERAKRFYGTVFGWEWQAGSVPNAWSPAGHAGEEFGIWGDRSQEPEVQLCYRVTDLRVALRRVAEAGGEAGEIERKPYGLMASCVDDQGAHFQLWQPAD
jgi:uncharacterized glyoxalase superfamily protein PhnB